MIYLLTGPYASKNQRGVRLQATGRYYRGHSTKYSMGASDSGTPRCEVSWQGIDRDSYLAYFPATLAIVLLTQFCTWIPQSNVPSPTPFHGDRASGTCNHDVLFSFEDGRINRLCSACLINCWVVYGVRARTPVKPAQCIDVGKARGLKCVAGGFWLIIHAIDWIRLLPLDNISTRSAVALIPWADFNQ